MNDFIDITCYEINDTEFKNPTSITLPTSQDIVYKEDNNYFIKYFHYQYKDGKLFNKTESIMRLKLEEYKRIKKFLKP